MFDLFSEQPHFLFLLLEGLIVVGLPMLAILSIAYMSNSRKHRMAKFAHDLKGKMIAAGMSADEIERVLATTVSEN
jgi:hypothetical protein